MGNNSLEVYKKSITNTFDFLKSAQTIQEAYLRAIPIGSNDGYLLPVCSFHLEDAYLISQLTEWRNKNVKAYPTQFTATLDSTSAWLKGNVLSVPDRILFLIVNNTGKNIGHIGFNNCFNENLLFEIDNVVRGVRNLDKGIISKSLLALITWASRVINTNGFFSRVLSDDIKAIDFYELNSFSRESELPLISEVQGDILSYRPAEEGEQTDNSLLRMKYDPKHVVAKSMILTAGPSISAREAVYSYDAALNGWNNQWSKYITRFETAFAEYVGTKYAISTSSCTGALQIALMSLDIGVGDEVIVPDQTWVATANAVRYVGAIPIFADVELDTWNLDANSVESLITSRTKAIIVVHMYGHPARMNALIDIAKSYNLKLVEDAAPAIGAEWQGKRCGSFGEFAAFSFQGAKLLVTGEGGMLVTNDATLYSKAKKIWDQGRNPSKAFWIDADGVKFKMSNIQAALGLGQLERVDELIAMKRRIFSWYEDGLSDVDHIVLNKEVKGARSIYWMTSTFLEESAPLDRDDLIKLLKQKNIDTRPVFPAISQYPIWGQRQQPKPVAMRIGLRAINLPSGVCLTKSEVDYVCATLRQVLNEKK